MTPLELEQRARRAYDDSWRCWDPDWQELSQPQQDRLLRFAEHLLKDLEDYRQRLLEAYGMARLVFERTAPVYLQEVQRRELEPPPDVVVGDQVYRFDRQRWEQVTGGSDRWLDRKTEPKRTT